MRDTARRDTDFSPTEWLSAAQRHLEVAEAYARIRDSAKPRHACFWAGESARFALRAALVATNSPTRESDSLTELADLLPPSLVSIVRHPAISVLARYGEEISYPVGEILDLTWQDAEEAVRQANERLAAVQDALALIRRNHQPVMGE